MTNEPHATLQQIFAARYSDGPEVGQPAHPSALLRSMAAGGSCRAFLDRPVPSAWVDILCATALAAPTKSDLQQRDIVLLQSADDGRLLR